MEPAVLRLSVSYMSASEGQSKLHVVIAGAGVAGLEALMGLRDIADDSVRITIVSPDADFVYRPLTVGEPFALGPALRIPVAQVARDFHAEHRPESLSAVAPESHEVLLGNGESLAYDKLIVALGGRREAVYGHSTTFRGQEDSEAMHGLVQDVEQGYSRKIAFVVPSGVAWSLPLYELALMTARRAYEMSIDAELTLVTPEERPLAIFGAKASNDVEALLSEAGIRVHCSRTAEVPAQGTVQLRPGGETLHCDRVVALPVVRGPRIEGLPQDADGFIPIGDDASVRGVDDVFAAGDGTNFPIKQGGIACQQADVAAACIARAAGIPVEVRPFRPVLRGQLMTGGKPQFMRRDVGDPTGGEESTEHMLWWPPSKVAGKYLAAYLALQEESERAGRDPDVKRRWVLANAVNDAGEVELHGYEFAAR